VVDVQKRPALSRGTRIVFSSSNSASTRRPSGNAKQYALAGPSPGIRIVFAPGAVIQAGKLL
jgi:hypothetical protein